MKKFLIFALCLTLLSACESAPAEEVTFDMPTVNPDEVIEAVIEESTESDLTYINEEYGFSLDFPEIWEGYVVTSFDDVEYAYGRGYYFGFGDSYDRMLISVSIATHEEWEALQFFDSPIPTYLGESEEWVFAGSASHEAAEEYTEHRMGYQDVFDTLEVL